MYCGVTVMPGLAALKSAAIFFSASSFCLVWTCQKSTWTVLPFRSTLSTSLPWPAVAGELLRDDGLARCELGGIDRSRGCRTARRRRAGRCRAGGGRRRATRRGRDCGGRCARRTESWLLVGAGCRVGASWRGRCRPAGGRGRRARWLRRIGRLAAAAGRENRCGRTPRDASRASSAGSIVCQTIRFTHRATPLYTTHPEPLPTRERNRKTSPPAPSPMGRGDSSQCRDVPKHRSSKVSHPFPRGEGAGD